jgi:ABC-type dipeptide/oligopeptide/nickel transport system permease component
MPALVLAARPTAYVARVTARLLADTEREHFIRTAHAKGLAGAVVLVRHTLRASAPGVLAAIVLGLRLAVGTLPIVEIVFVYPGMGFTFLSALRSGDVAPAVALATVIALTLWLLSLAADAARRALDPRLALAESGGTKR